MLFAEYYGDPFRSDLAYVSAGLPPSHEHEPGSVVLQPRTLSTRNPAVLAMTAERRSLFGVALFLTVVADQVCYTYFRAHYVHFRELTRYPKLKGDCPGGCRMNIHPSNALAVGHRAGANSRGDSDLWSPLPSDVISVMRTEVHSFVTEHLSGITPEEFWQRVDREIPLYLRLRVGLERPGAGKIERRGH